MSEKTKQQEIAEFEKWYKEWKSNNDTPPFSTCSIKERMMIAFIAGMSAQ